MNPLTFIEQTTVIGAPKDWDKTQGECAGLPVRQEGDTLTSYWKPTQKELATLCAGGAVKLKVFSLYHPALMITADFCGEMP